MTSPLRPALRHRSPSHISFLPDDPAFPSHSHSQSDTLSPLKGPSGWRNTSPQKKWHVVIEFGGEFVVREQMRKEFDDDGGSVLAVLQATPHQQLVHLLPQLHLPSPLGLFFTLVIPYPSARKAPKVTDSLWPTLFSSHLIPDPSPPLAHSNPSYGCLPIAATLELKVDKDLARWWNGWLREGEGGFGVGMNLGISSRMADAERKRVDSIRSVKSMEPVIDSEATKNDRQEDASVSIEVVSLPATLAPWPASLSQQPLKVQICGFAPSLRPSPSREISEPDLAPLEPSNPPPAAREIPVPLETFDLPTSPKDIPESPYDNGYTSSVPYSPTLSPPAPEALASQRFLQDLQGMLEGVQKEKKNLEVKVTSDVPWADLASAAWSEATSWGPPDTPSPVISPRPLTPPIAASAEPIITRETEIHPHAPHPEVIEMERDIQVQRHLPSSNVAHHEPNSEDSKGYGHHPSWTFLPRGPVEAKPWEHNWPYYRSQDVPEPEGLKQFPREEHAHVQEEIKVVVTHEKEQAVETSLADLVSPQASAFAKQQAFASPQAPLSRDIVAEGLDTASEFEFDAGYFPSHSGANGEEESDDLEGFDIITPFQEPSSVLGKKPEDLNFDMPSRQFVREDYIPDTPSSPFDSDSSQEEFESTDPGGALMDMMAPLSRVSAAVQPVMHARAPLLGTALDVIEEAEDSSVESPLVPRGSALPEVRIIQTTVEHAPSQEEDTETFEGTVVSSQMETWETGLVGEVEVHTLSGQEVPRIVENRSTEVEQRDSESRSTTPEEQPLPPPPYEPMFNPLPRQAIMGPFPQIAPRPPSHLFSPNLINQMSPRMASPYSRSGVGSLPDPHVRLDPQRSDEGRPMSRGMTGLDPRQNMRPTPPSFHADSSDSEEERRVEVWEQHETPQTRRSIFRPRFSRSQSHFDTSTSSTPVHAPRSSSISNLSSVNIYRSSAAYEGARDSTFSLASVTSTSSKAPARPLKRLSKSVSGFSGAQSVEADGALNGLRPAMMSLRDSSMYVEGKGYPYLEIYHPPRARLVSATVYSSVYPRLEIYAPAKSAIILTERQVKLVDYSYPAIVIYPAVDRARSAPRTISVRLVDYQYPAIALYPVVARPVSRMVWHPATAVRSIKVMLVDFSYPNIILYPAACSVKRVIKREVETRKTSVKLVEYAYPDIVLYPAVIRAVKPVPRVLISAPPTQWTPMSKSIRVDLVPITYPDLVIYPAMAPVYREMDMAHLGASVKVKRADYTYPHIVLYPAVAGKRNVKAPVRSTCQVKLVDYNYPNIVLYPAAATRVRVRREVRMSSVQVELVPFSYPNLIIYPATSARRDVGIFGSRSAVKVELVEFLYPDIVLYSSMSQPRASSSPVVIAEASSGTVTPSDNGYTSSVPYSPNTCFAQPSYEALSTQPFLMELHSLLEDVAERKAKELLVKISNDVPWKDLSSAQWSEATSWGPPDTPSNYEYPVATVAPRIDNIAKSIGALRSVDVLLRPFTYPDLVIYPAAIQVKLVQYVYPDIVLYPVMPNRARSNRKTHQQLVAETVHEHKAPPDDKYLSVADGLLEAARRRYEAVRSSLSKIDTEMIPPPNHHRSGSSVSSIQSASTQAINTPASALSPSSSTRSRSQSYLHSRSPSNSSLPSAKPPPKDALPALPALPVTGTLKGDLLKFGHSRSSSSVRSTAASTAVEGNSPGVLSPQSTGTRTPTRARSSTLVSERMKALMEQTQKSPPLPPSAVNVRGIRSSTYGTMSPPHISSTESTPTKVEEKPGHRPVGKLSNTMFRNWQ
ncbi:hypothetical protein L198_01698 [Cryptococcus wingfieldii CBS 7118]|uniref:Uncharacterized protein n=1 Tax=Cryptococcus wingfieldii CBS 7118 TaxID=1295528 RepID=A0A1E3K082_9TREE|nr:hypothetical protein L198_01698 [Cryptococcus wingfieldii CBS 7118]ODO06466.1 hypothetical protein L198_01698 [Cryptococcus wingfieldii CBS 7118]